MNGLPAIQPRKVINNPDALTLFYPDPKQRQRTARKNLKNANQKFMSREWQMYFNRQRWDSENNFLVSSSQWYFHPWMALSWAIGVEVTARVEAMAALENSEAQYRRIVETADEGIWMIDAENKTSFANQKLAAMLGYTMAEMMGTGLFDFMDEAGIEVAKTNWNVAARE